jgi:flagellar motor component MotA
MPDNSYIPVGRTSLVRRGRLDLQVQTEYAPRPYPRITTTVLSGGQVLHKIEKKLEEPIRSQEEQHRAQRVIRQQHADVTSLLESGSTILPSGPDEKKKPAVPGATPTRDRSLTERLAAINGIQRIYQVDNNGNFIGNGSSDQFKRAFAPVFKHLQDLLAVFVQLPGNNNRREQGVYEIERDRLYVVSTGREFYFVVVKRADRDTNYEQSLRNAVKQDIPIA